MSKTEQESVCMICGSKADAGSRGNGVVSPYSWGLTCKDHAKYHDKYQYEVIQKQLGIIDEYSDRLKTCLICECALTEKEIDSIEENQIQIVCTEHSEVKSWLRSDMAILWFEYKELNSDANADKDAGAFGKWVREKN